MQQYSGDRFAAKQNTGSAAGKDQKERTDRDDQMSSKGIPLILALISVVMLLLLSGVSLW